jgi:hypothetical protein
MTVNLRQKRKPGGGRPTKSGATLVVARVHPEIAKNPTEFYTRHEELMELIEHWRDEAEGKTSPRWGQAKRLIAELADYLLEK